MTYHEFEATLRDDRPPGGLSPYLRALWQDKRNDWAGAHGIVQDIDDRDAAWIHAYLHRKEGDGDNARYWYRQAGRSFPSGQPFDQEWEDLIRYFLSSPD